VQLARSRNQALARRREARQHLRHSCFMARVQPSPRLGCDTTRPKNDRPPRFVLRQRLPTCVHVRGGQQQKSA
jgi:hypothetical protein